MGGCDSSDDEPDTLNNVEINSIPLQERQGGTLRVAFTDNPDHLDPARFTSGESYQIGFAVYDSLIWIDSKLNLHPGLALSWTFSEDLLSWTLVLRENVRFHHGTTFTSKDVVHTFNRLLDPEINSPLRAVLNFIDLVEAIHPYTVRFHLNSPNAELPLLLGAPQARIVPHDRSDALLAEKPSGTGPFQLIEYLPSNHATLTRYEQYWQKDQPLLDEVKYLYLSDPISQIAGLHDGTIDMMWQLAIEQIPSIEDDEALVIRESSGGGYRTIVMQMTKEPFTDKRIRQALKYCVDRSEVQEEILDGLGELGNDQPIAPVNPFWADIPIREQDIDKARELLAEAGYPDGLDLQLVTSTNRSGMQEICYMLRDAAQPAGINIEVITVPPDVYWGEYWSQVPFHVGNWFFRSSIDEALTVSFHSEAPWNEGDWRSPTLDRLIERARSEPMVEKRKALYREIQQMVIDDGPVIISVFQPVLVATHNRVQGFDPHPSNWLNLRNTWLLS